MFCDSKHSITKKKKKTNLKIENEAVPLEKKTKQNNLDSSMTYGF